MWKDFPFYSILRDFLVFIDLLLINLSIPFLDKINGLVYGVLFVICSFFLLVFWQEFFICF